MSARKSLPQEIIEAILRRLPAKSLGRFKFVSKPWRSLISNPEFIKTHLHLNNHHKINKLIIVSNMKSLYSVNINEVLQYLNSNDLSATGKELSFRPPSIRWEKILGSCNGLVLAKDEDGTIFLLNPTTQEISELLVFPSALPLGESFVMYGFGYDSSSDDYKVVSISFWDTDNEHNPNCTDMFVSVYSLRNNSWKKVHNSPYDHAVGHLLSGVLINENLHWLTQRIPSYSSTIVAFSLAKEEFNEIELPASIDNNKTAVFNKLVVLGEKLAIFGNQVGNDLWLMEEYDVGESWTNVSIDGVEIDPVKPVCLVDGSNRDIVLGDEDGVIVYNLDDRRCKNVWVLGAPIAFAVGGTYHESLVSPKFITTPP
ncbi:hypothetical protein L6452_40434 [Arctium lappa]|uniref:Uncharacterized protein n=1 Tax=Arctium lappa TaxID=4217 RepID=A0ACB8XMG8_ARCLA|nr:hypothetical protein L6452_40434 [Arctium lappa]